MYTITKPREVDAFSSRVNSRGLLLFRLAEAIEFMLRSHVGDDSEHAKALKEAMDWFAETNLTDVE